MHTIVVHSSREGTGKSTVAANVAALLAAQGQRIGIVDADLQSESLHFLFGLNEEDIVYTLNDYLAGRCDGSKVLHDVTAALMPLEPSGHVFLVPASSDASDFTRRLNGGYNLELFTDGLWDLTEEAGLDCLLIDTHAMLSDETLFSMLSIAICDVLVIVLRLDQRDYQETGVTLDVARALEVPEIVLVANQVSPTFVVQDVQSELEKTYSSPVIGILPYLDEIMLLSLGNLFVCCYPDHPVSQSFAHVADYLRKGIVKVV